MKNLKNQEAYNSANEWDKVKLVLDWENINTNDIVKNYNKDRVDLDNLKIDNKEKSGNDFNVVDEMDVSNNHTDKQSIDEWTLWNYKEIIKDESFTDQQPNSVIEEPTNNSVNGNSSKNQINDVNNNIKKENMLDTYTWKIIEEKSEIETRSTTPTACKRYKKWDKEMGELIRTKIAGKTVLYSPSLLAFENYRRVNNDNSWDYFVSQTFTDKKMYVYNLLTDNFKYYFSWSTLVIEWLCDDIKSWELVVGQDILWTAYWSNENGFNSSVPITLNNMNISYKINDWKIVIDLGEYNLNELRKAANPNFEDYKKIVPFWKNWVDEKNKKNLIKVDLSLLYKVKEFNWAKTYTQYDDRVSQSLYLPIYWMIEPQKVDLSQYPNYDF